MNFEVRRWVMCQRKARCKFWVLVEERAGTGENVSSEFSSVTFHHLTLIEIRQNGSFWVNVATLVHAQILAASMPVLVMNSE